MRLYWGDPFFVSLLRRPTRDEERSVVARGQSLGFNYECPGASRDLVWPQEDDDDLANADQRQQRQKRRAPSPLPLPSAAQRDAALNGGWAVDRARVKVGYGRDAYLQTRDLVKRWGAFQLPWARVDADATGTKPGASGVCVAARLLGGLVWTAVPLQVTVCEEQRRWQVLRRRQEGEEEQRGGAGGGRRGLGKQQQDDGAWEEQPSSSSGGKGGRRRFLLAHGCLRSHFLAGEERFTVEWHRPPPKKTQGKGKGKRGSGLSGGGSGDDDPSSSLFGEDRGPVYFEVATFSRPAHPLAALGYPVVRALQAAYRHDATRHVARMAAVATVDRSTGGIEAAGPWWETELVGGAAGGGDGEGGSSKGGSRRGGNNGGWVGVLAGLVAGAAGGGAAARAATAEATPKERAQRAQQRQRRGGSAAHQCACCCDGGSGSRSSHW
jgi:uncharacterized protein (UPF0548 family)